MKLRHIFSLALAALLAIGCSDENTVDPLGSITLDQTFVSIPADGGDASITVKASGDWAFDKIFNVGKDADGNAIYAELPTWLTADKTAGSAGETVVTFHADKATAAAATFGKVCTDRNSGSYRNFLVLFCNSDIKPEDGSLDYGAKLFDQKIYIDNLRVVSIESITVSDF